MGIKALMNWEQGVKLLSIECLGLQSSFLHNQFPQLTLPTRGPCGRFFHARFFVSWQGFLFQRGESKIDASLFDWATA